MEDIQMVQQYVDLDKSIKESIKQRDELGAKILANHSEKDIYGLLRQETKKTLDSDQLKATVTPSLWISITKRVPVMALVNAAVVKNQISKEELDSCRVEGRPYLKRI